MEEEVKGLQDYLLILKRYKNQMLITAIIVFMLALVIAFKLPSVYKSTATILIEQQEIPQEMIRSTVTSYADQRIQVISQRVMTTENLAAIIDKFNLFTEEKKTETRTALFEKMREDIQLDMVSADVVDPQSGRPTQATIAFTLSFSSRSPKLAQQVANELVSLYLNENLKRRNLAATETTDFLAIEADKLRVQIKELETKLAEFKEKNAASLPELQQLNMQLMERTDQQIADYDRQLNSLTERKLYLEAELAQLSPNLSTFSATGERIYGSGDRLKTLQAEYVALIARYADTHPDVIKTRREISALENEIGGIDKTEIYNQLNAKKAELTALSERYSQEHPDIKKLKQVIKGLQQDLDRPVKTKHVITDKPDNPAYIQLQSQLQAANADITAIRASKIRLMEKLEGHEKNLMEMPQVEREYNDLIRDYENSTTKYREVKDKQMQADMAQAMEKDRKGERFSLIEPPLFPEKPFKPNREAIVFLGFILAIGSAFGLALLRSSLDPSIYGSKALMAITGAPLLVKIPYIENDEDLLKKGQLRSRVLYTGAFFIIISMILFHLLLMPLDVLWYVVLRKLGYSVVLPVQ